MIFEDFLEIGESLIWNLREYPLENFLDEKLWILLDIHSWELFLEIPAKLLESPISTHEKPADNRSFCDLLDEFDFFFCDLYIAIGIDQDTLTGWKLEDIVTILGMGTYDI